MMPNATEVKIKEKHLDQRGHPYKSQGTKHISSRL